MSEKKAVMLGAIVGFKILILFLFMIMYFFTNEINPMNWNIWVKIATVIIILYILGHVFEVYDQKIKECKNENKGVL